MIDEQQREAAAFWDEISGHLARYRFVVVNEAELQDRVFEVLKKIGYKISREVVTSGGRFDLEIMIGTVRIVLELKVKGPVADVERQAQRYALREDVHLVAVLSSKYKLAAELVAGCLTIDPAARTPLWPTLGGKPFRVQHLGAM